MACRLQQLAGHNATFIRSYVTDIQMERAWDNKQDYGTMGLSISTGDPTGDPISLLLLLPMGVAAAGRVLSLPRPLASS